MTKAGQTAAIHKWGRMYPNLWPLYQVWSADFYRQDRIERGVE